MYNAIYLDFRPPGLMLVGVFSKAKAEAMIPANFLMHPLPPCGLLPHNFAALLASRHLL